MANPGNTGFKPAGGSGLFGNTTTSTPAFGGNTPSFGSNPNLLKAYLELTQQAQEGAYSATKQPLSPPLQPLCLVAAQDLTLNPKMGGFSASRNLLLEDYSPTLSLASNWRIIRAITTTNWRTLWRS